MDKKLEQLTHDIENYFYQEDFKSMVKVIDEGALNNSYLESFDSCEFIYYSLAGLMAIDDYLKVWQFIKLCGVLKTPELMYYRQSDGANYLNLLKENESIQEVMIMVIFLESNKELTLLHSTYEELVSLGIQYFEMISNLYELGYSNKIVKKMTEIGHIIYKI